MEYIECTHCGKRYTTNEKIRKSQGDFVRCKHCLEKFMIVIHGSEESDDLEASGSWDPTLTIPPEEQKPKEKDAEPTSDVSEDSAIIEWDPSATMPEADSADSETDEPELTDEEIQEQAEATLQNIKDAKKKKYITYAALTALLILLGLTLYVALADNDAETLTQSNVVQPKRLSAKELDKNNPECREAAAQQWLLDYQAMHGNYTAKAFMDMIKQSQVKTTAVKDVCKASTLLKSILESATAKEKPDWFAAEIKALQ